MRRVVLVDDHAMFRTGVRAELAGHADVVGEAADVDEAVRVVTETQPDVVLLDVHLPGGGGAEVMRRTTGRAGAVRFLALSVSDAAEDVIGTIRAGARGYVTKSITGRELVDAIERVASGDAVFSPRLAGFVLDAFAGTIEVAAVDEIPGQRPGPVAGPGLEGGDELGLIDEAVLERQHPEQEVAVGGGHGAAPVDFNRPARLARGAKRRRLKIPPT